METIHNHVTDLEDYLLARLEEVHRARSDDYKNYLRMRLCEDVIQKVLTLNGMTMRQAKNLLRKAVRT